MTEERFQEWLLQANISGRSHVSNLADEILKKQDQSVERAVNKYINGKLDTMKIHLERQDGILEDIKQQVQAIKLDTDPIVDAKKSLTFLGKVALWLSIIFGAILTFLKFIK